MPIIKVKWNRRNSITASGRIAPSIAPSRFETYRKLNDRRDSNGGSLRTANIANGIVAPISAHHGTKVSAMHTPEIKEYMTDENSVELARWARMRCPIINSKGTPRAEIPISSSDPAYNHNGGKESFC